MVAGVLILSCEKTGYFLGIGMDRFARVSVETLNRNWMEVNEDVWVPPIPLLLGFLISKAEGTSTLILALSVSRLNGNWWPLRLPENVMRTFWTQGDFRNPNGDKFLALFDWCLGCLLVGSFSSSD